jgi:5'(3')-deoxyribonucleotidase
MKIDPKSLAFDLDSVVADTMALFLDIARDNYRIDGIRYEDITGYNLKECLDIDATVIDDIVNRIHDGGYTAILKPMPGAPEVLTKVSRNHSPVLLVTARPYPGPIYDWIDKTVSLNPSDVEIITTGSHDGKGTVLVDRGIDYFVEDRLETCYSLQAAGVIPILFKQPWNRMEHPFIEVDNWFELESLIDMS